MSLKKTNLNSIVDLRQATDDNLAGILSEFGYDESFVLIDTKLALGYSTVIIAALLFYIDKKYTFAESFNVTLSSVVVYFLISGVLLYINRTNKNVKYVGSTSKGAKITIAGWTHKYDPEYYVKIVLNGDEQTAVTAKIPFNKYFDITGYFNRDAFAALLKPEVDAAAKKNI